MVEELDIEQILAFVNECIILKNFDSQICFNLFCLYHTFVAKVKAKNPVCLPLVAKKLERSVG